MADEYVFTLPTAKVKERAKKPTPLAVPAIATGDDAALPVSAIANQFSDMRLSSVFAKMFSEELRYWPEVGKFIIFDGCRWTTDAPGGAFPYIRKMIESLFQKAAENSDYAVRQDMLKAIFKLESHPRQETLLAAAKTRPELIISAAELDQHHLLLTASNGVIDLQTGQLRPCRADDFITRMTPIEYDPAAKCTLWIAFLNQIFESNQSVIDYLQRFIGYCLTGLTTEQVLLFLYGTGANGKSVLANILDALLGDFASSATSDLLMARDNRGASNDVAALRGARLVKVSEFEESDRLAEAQIKTLTGGDQVSCRHLYQEYFSYTPTYKILLIGNHAPKIRNTDYGIRRRLHRLNFQVTIPPEERDPRLQDKLLKELPGILAWAVQGCLAWQKQGLAAPEEIKSAVEEYLRSEDIFSQWLDDCCNRGEQFTTPASDLLESFIVFSKWKGTTSTKLGKMLSEAGFIREKSSGIKWRGLSLLQAAKKHHWQDRADEPPF